MDFDFEELIKLINETNDNILNGKPVQQTLTNLDLQLNISFDQMSSVQNAMELVSKELLKNYSEKIDELLKNLLKMFVCYCVMVFFLVIILKKMILYIFLLVMLCIFLV